MSFKEQFRSRVGDLKRKKPETQKKFENFKSPGFSCVICNIVLQDKVLYDVHSKTKEHMEKAEKLSSKNELRPKKRKVQVQEDVTTNDLEIIHSNTIVKQPKLCVESVQITSEPVTQSHAVEGLPEGFFDDPKLDAKARNVSFIDKFESKFEEFQKDLKEDFKAVDQMFEQRWEEAEIAKDQNEVDRMETCINRMFLLRKMVDSNIESKVSTLKNEETDTFQGSSDSEDVDPGALLGWRSKNPLNI